MLTMCALNVGGSLSFKAYVTNGNLWLMVAGFATWGVGALLYLCLLRMQDLAIVGMATSVVQVSLVIAAGVFLFGEQLLARQVIAILIALIAMTVAMLPATAG